MIIDRLFIKKTADLKEEEILSNSETPIRSILKSISWRVVGTIDTVLISWLVIGDISLAFAIGSVELITKMILYFFHERMWNKIKWGKQ
ncbi:DUF2061 domain-containing protein [Lutibacter sp.]|uniref:DUF2061 domain-containing protein n=1 Tax=Lutibacter sp. TaxID=1925666 RepID=UPI0025C4384D|nr:DUF2061 domain-containing protein [Lutibacter sp.]MCF6182987.1 DUF2061 domain-containing protein [Lutibacter sp.]